MLPATARLRAGTGLGADLRGDPRGAAVRVPPESAGGLLLPRRGGALRLLGPFQGALPSRRLQQPDSRSLAVHQVEAARHLTHLRNLVALGRGAGANVHIEMRYTRFARSTAATSAKAAEEAGLKLLTLVRERAELGASWVAGNARYDETSSH